jgi:hypothetical protein
MLVDAGHERDEEARRARVLAASNELTADEVYLATMVISLFQFYNSFVDLNGVNELSAAGYDASGARLCNHGYAPPAETPSP